MVSKMTLPPIRPVYLEGLKKIVEVDADWVPHEFGTSLYLRPFNHSDGRGAGRARRAPLSLLHHMLPTQGSYYARGINPVKGHDPSRDVRTRGARRRRLCQVRRQLCGLSDYNTAQTREGRGRTSPRVLFAVA